MAWTVGHSTKDAGAKDATFMKSLAATTGSGFRVAEAVSVREFVNRTADPKYMEALEKSQKQYEPATPAAATTNVSRTPNTPSTAPKK
jgi:hypothetical protein